MNDQRSFTPGDRVEVINGPFATFAGRVEAVNGERQMLKVRVELGNSPLVRAGTGGVPVELRFKEVRKTA
jgi:transcription antitermination factor NusG